MKIYLAGERDIFSEDGTQQGWASATGYVEAMNRYVKRRLFSFYYHGFSGGKGGVSGKADTDGLTPDVKSTAAAHIEMFLDSGAFTAWSQNVEISLEEYAAYINKHGHLYGTVSNLDDTSKNERRSYDNQKALESMGCKVQPVFHAREDARWLVKYLDEGYDYIFLGGLVPESTQWLLQWLDDLWDRYLIKADGTPRVKVHGFGLTDQKLMFRYPWHSVDSSSWLMTGIFGGCLFRHGQRLVKVVFSDSSPESYKLDGWHYRNLPAPQRAMVDRWIEPYGVTPEQLGKHYTYRDVINAAVFQGLEDMGTRTFRREQEVLF